MPGRQLDARGRGLDKVPNRIEVLDFSVRVTKTTIPIGADEESDRPYFLTTSELEGRYVHLDLWEIELEYVAELSSNDDLDTAPLLWSLSDCGSIFHCRFSIATFAVS